MAIKSETRLGPYEIVSALGAGGMGEVYRARDPRLKREVAIKVLPSSFSSDPQRSPSAHIRHAKGTRLFDAMWRAGAAF